MEIQRQSDYYGLDRPEIHQASLTAEQIRDMTSGPSITPGMLNTRIAAVEDPDPSEQEGVSDEDWRAWKKRNLDENGEVLGNPNSRKERERRRDRDWQDWIDRGAPHHGAHRQANPAALMRLLPLLEMGGGGGGVLDQALGDVSGAESKAAFDRAAEEY